MKTKQEKIKTARRRERDSLKDYEGVEKIDGS